MNANALEVTARTVDRAPVRASWRDPGTGCTLIAAQPSAETELWREYLDGAHRTYWRYGVERVLDLETVREGTDTAMFFAALDDHGRVVAGARAIGPLRSADDSDAVVEWAGSPDLPAVRSAIADRVPFGIMEAKSAWVDSGAQVPGSLSDTLARVPMWLMSLFGTQFVLATAADYLLRRWSSSGGVVAPIAAAPYPNANYRTKLMWWDRRTFATNAEPQQLSRWLAESQMSLDVDVPA